MIKGKKHGIFNSRVLGSLDNDDNTSLLSSDEKVLGVYDKNNIVYKHKILGGILFGVFSLLATPFFSVFVLRTSERSISEVIFKSSNRK